MLAHNLMILAVITCTGRLATTQGTDDYTTIHCDFNLQFGKLHIWIYDVMMYQ